MNTTKYVKAAIGKRIGRPIPYINVTKVTFNIAEYLKWMKYSGPEYKSIYTYIEVFFVLYVSEPKLLSFSLKTNLYE